MGRSGTSGTLRPEGALPKGGSTLATMGTLGRVLEVLAGGAAFLGVFLEGWGATVSSSSSSSGSEAMLRAVSRDLRKATSSGDLLDARRSSVQSGMFSIRLQKAFYIKSARNTKCLAVHMLSP